MQLIKQFPIGPGVDWHPALSNASVTANAIASQIPPDCQAA